MTFASSKLCGSITHHSAKTNDSNVEGLHFNEVESGEEEGCKDLKCTNVHLA